MRFEPCYKRPFASFVKKQHKPFQAVIEDAVDVICADPAIGEAKIGDLAGIFVYKFTYKKQLYLIADHVPDVGHAKDRIEDSALEHESPQFLFIDFYQMGSHENFYDDLKAYLKADGWYKCA